MLAQTLMVYQKGGSDFRATMRADLPELKLKWERGPKGDRYQTTIAFDPDKVHAGSYKGSLLIDTNDPAFPNCSDFGPDFGPISLELATVVTNAAMIAATAFRFEPLGDCRMRFALFIASPLPQDPSLLQFDDKRLPRRMHDNVLLCR
jgi:hypothetical protein